MKRLFLLMLGIMLVAGACSQETTTTYQGEVAGMDLTLQYPAEWTATETEVGLTLSAAPDADGEETAVPLPSVTIKTLPTSVVLVENLADLLRLEIDTLRADQQVVQRGDIEETTINEKEAVTAVLDTGNGTTFHYTIIRGETTLALVLGEVAPDAPETDTETVQAIINSINFGSIMQ